MKPPRIRLFYAVASEGLGHVTRALAVVDKLSEDFEVHLFTSGKAHAYLAAQDYPYLHKIDALLFETSKRGQISYVRSLIGTRKFIRYQYPRQVEVLCKLARELKPSLCITDFDPTMPRVARRIGVPCISIDCQHRFRFCSSRGLPLPLRLYWAVTGCFIRLLVPSVEHTIVGVFCYDHLRLTRAGRNRNVTLTNGMLRSALDGYQPKDDGFVLVYLHRQFHQEGDLILHHVGKLPVDCRVYGYGPGPSRERLVFKEFSYGGFIRDLANCRALISHAGTQLMAEARFYGKPVLAVPVSKQYEQYVNALYVERVGLGAVCRLSELSAKYISDFLERHTPAANRPAGAMERNGADDAVRIVRRHLSMD